MLNFNRRDRSAEGKDGDKSALKPALYEPPGTPPRTGAANANRAAAVPTPTTMIRDGSLTAAVALHDESSAKPAAAGSGITLVSQGTPTEGSQLRVGVDIKLTGAEITDCDVLVIEGQVDATVRSKAMQIAKPGTLKGTAQIDVAEIHGEFVGELTARTRLVVHATGRVSGTIRYGKLVVAEGGELSGDIQRIEGPSELAH